MRQRPRNPTAIAHSEPTSSLGTPSTIAPQCTALLSAIAHSEPTSSLGTPDSREAGVREAAYAIMDWIFFWKPFFEKAHTEGV
jgi:hypothetical protein